MKRNRCHQVDPGGSSPLQCGLRFRPIVATYVRMRTLRFSVSTIACVMPLIAVLAGGLPFSETEGQFLRLKQTERGKVRIEVERPFSLLQIETHAVGGFLDVEKDFVTKLKQPATVGKVEARGEVVTVAGALKSRDESVAPWTGKTDETMHRYLQADKHPRIVFRLDQLVLKEAPKSEKAPYLFEAAGRLAIAGVTNEISIPVELTPLGQRRLRIETTFWLKPSDYGIRFRGLHRSGGPSDLESKGVKIAAEWVVAEST